MKHIIKVQSLENLPDTRPLIAIDGNGNLFAEGVKTIPEGFVDFGLPSGTLWTTNNIGANPGSTPESYYGNYYAWGETETKSNYSWNTYKFGASHPFSKYDTDGKTVLESVDDVATTIYGADYHIPTIEDFKELIAGTSSNWVENYNNIEGLNGRLFKKATITRSAFKNITLYSSIFEGEVTNEIWAELSLATLEEINTMIGGDIREMMFINPEKSVPAKYDTDYGFVIKQVDPSISMFVPAAGFFDGSSVSNTNFGVWLSSLGMNNPIVAINIYFDSDDIFGTNYNDRYIGYPIRAVRL